MSQSDTVEISGDHLPTLDHVTALVQDDGAGAITTFSGTTRNVFEDKVVVELEYEAYIPMAKKVLLDIIKESRAKWDLKHVAIFHRTGVVPVGKTSVIVATSSKHRADSMDAARYLIDELKDRCPIWKKEVYENGSVWKGACSGQHNAQK
ncbi:molybdenum cofactor synthesis protein 2 large subunit [Mucor mucedo]|uniref:molybdenum cofactor synthesis protein 2 large subunit n=1 Tax=Mucor mucedo TaxID=29922 RepID=UPI00221FE76A|nr:molybdenum cofactor synthesis protein 2 large subunit [Mucor mucedo]KAI7888153.1 molybdenum cofactor synthesis protein 2 large subunit [Mucor mucedo]